MRAIGVRELRANVASTIRAASAGERVMVTVSGTPVAQLGPVDVGPGDVTLAQLAATGALVPPRRRDPLDPQRVILTWPGLRIDRLLRELRG